MKATKKEMWRRQLQEFVRVFDIIGFVRGTNNQEKYEMCRRMLEDFKKTRMGK